MTLRLAFKFLKKLSTKLDFEYYINDYGQNKFQIDQYQNGREKGFAVTKNEPRQFNGNDSEFKKIVFAENRNSDQLVIYYGLARQFNGETWEIKRYNNGTKGLDYNWYLSDANKNHPIEPVYRYQTKYYSIDYPENKKEFEKAIKFVLRFFNKPTNYKKRLRELEEFIAPLRVGTKLYSKELLQNWDHIGFLQSNPQHNKDNEEIVYKNFEVIKV